MKTVEIVCCNCNKLILKPIGEFNRSSKLKRPMYCSGTSSTIATNNKFGRPQIKEIIKICDLCKKEFSSISSKKCKTHFCSRKCASVGSVTEKRREAHRQSGLKNAVNLISTEKAMKIREAWRYEKIVVFLKEEGIIFDTEYPIENYLFDLVLLNAKIIIEFDGPDHSNNYVTIETDKRKEMVASQKGFRLIRVAVKPNTVIEPELITDIVYSVQNR